ncbi:hypothetical protein RWK44_21165 [Rhizobium sp. 25PS6]|uniref:hypothetical protein n=1 Tax=Rhizobium TaxID=379 RepID=UPI00103EDB2E|nr:MULTISPECIES: hypothetical protein [Rhizobium]MBY3184231.1 hypothetical protein [Rhizobium laguerreae]MBY3380964.1 hypothetical protein [Rhizobium laguerreae]MDU0310704.1 hypothetical protein [Rhizobium sp. 10PS4]MDU0362904.1 hypothetical protein [Rhizobium sp. 25PS6]TBY06885.1 hypothetical protein E0J21_16400 [Rhizobium laguerreae]
MIMPQGIRKVALVVHVVSSVGSLGAVAAFLALAIIGLAGQDDRLVRSTYVAADVIARVVIVPLVMASFLSGLVQSLGTTWGLFRHYWVLVKFLLNLLVVVVLLLQVKGIVYLGVASLESTMSNSDQLDLRRSLVIHAAGGLVVLLVTTALSVYKPRGMTRYGWRRHHRPRPGGS